MDSLTLVLLVAAALLAGLLIFFQQRRAITAHQTNVPAVVPARREARQPRPEAMDNGPETRFVDSPRRRQYRLLNQVEQVLYQRLQEAMPAMRVFAQVGVAQLAQLRGRQEAMQLAAMAGRGVDFLVCGQDFSIVAAIELSWPTQEEGENTHEHEKRNALRSLGIPMIVYRPNALPDADTISREVAEAIVLRNQLEARRG